MKPKYEHPLAKRVAFARPTPASTCRIWMNHVYFQRDRVFALDGCRVAMIEGQQLTPFSETPIDANTLEAVPFCPNDWDKSFPTSFKNHVTIDRPKLLYALDASHYALQHSSEFVWWLKREKDKGYALGNCPIYLSHCGASGLEIGLTTNRPDIQKELGLGYDGWKIGLSRMDFDYKGPSFHIRVNWKFLHDAVRAIGAKSSLINIRFNPEGPFRLTGGMDKLANLIMPNKGS